MASLRSFGPWDWLMNGLVLSVAVAAFAVLARPALRNSRFWLATVTPLASIIGSGFLVVAPLLGSTVGQWAVLAMLGIVALAYAVGGAVRYNIEHVEDISDGDHASGLMQVALQWLERAARVALALAYLIAITFYLELLAAFMLQPFAFDERVWQKAIATALVVFIGVFGFARGLRQLEMLEKYSVDLKLAIIAGFLVGLLVLNIGELVQGSWSLGGREVAWNVETVRKLLGAFLIVQGFETSRYLGNVYRASERMATMRCAQLVSAAIYVAFIGLASILLGTIDTISETGVISLSSQVALIVPLLLIVGAIAAQFSAAVADMLASGGLVESATRGKLGHRGVYVAVAALAVMLLWTSHIFEVIAYASRAFAAYYAMQCLMAALHAATSRTTAHRMQKVVWFGLLSLAMLLTAVFGIPAESAGR